MFNTNNAFHVPRSRSQQELKWLALAQTEGTQTEGR